MAEFKLDTSGYVADHVEPGQHHQVKPVAWTDLDPFTQGYVEALFADLWKPEGRGWKWEPAYNGYVRPDYHPLGTGAKWEDYPSDVDADEAWIVDHDCDGPPRFSDLSPEALAMILRVTRAAKRQIEDGDIGVSGVGPREQGASLWRECQRGRWRDVHLRPLTITLADNGKIHLN